VLKEFSAAFEILDIEVRQGGEFGRYVRLLELRENGPVSIPLGYLGHERLGVKSTKRTKSTKSVSANSVFSPRRGPDRTAQANALG
jgi:hypothetical protein